MTFLLLLAALIRSDEQVARPTVIVVVGAEGAPEYAEQFATWSDRWRDAARRAGAQFESIGRQEPESAASTDRDALQARLESESKDGSHALWLVLIGHGTFDGKEAKFNLRGPDVAASQLALWLKPYKRPLAVINCTSASGPFISSLAGQGRVVIAATRSGHEHNFARFGDHMSTAVADPAADLDKDGQTSLLEAYLAASHKVEEFYKQEARLATEHALLDDNGDGLGTPANWYSGTRATRKAKDGASLDGTRAHQFHLLLSAQEQAMPANLRARRDELELAVEGLREKKESLKEDEYYQQLEQVLLELARLYEKTQRADSRHSAKSN
jgi:hypothetical protein